MGLDGPNRQTAGISPFVAWSCASPSPVLLLNSHLQFLHLFGDEPLQRCFSCRGTGTVGLYYCLSTYTNGKRVLRQRLATKVGAHNQGPWSYALGDGRGQTCSHEGHPFVLGFCMTFSVSGGTQRVPGRGSVFLSNARRLVLTKTSGCSMGSSSDRLCMYVLVPDMRCSGVVGDAQRNLLVFKSHSLFLRFLGV